MPAGPAGSLVLAVAHLVRSWPPAWPGSIIEAHQRHRPGRPSGLTETYRELHPPGNSRLQEQNRTIRQQMEALQRTPAGVYRPDREHERGLPAGGRAVPTSSPATTGRMRPAGRRRRSSAGPAQSDCRPAMRVAAGRGPGRAARPRPCMDLRRQVTGRFSPTPCIANGQVAGAVILIVDVTEREQREQPASGVLRQRLP